MGAEARMTSLVVSSGENESAYAQIEAAVMETARGRWFLAEFARRNRHAETDVILAAIEKLQNNIVSRAPAANPVVSHAPVAISDRLHNDILDMARAIAATQREIQAIGANGTTTTTHISASDELDNVVHTTEQATTSILAAAEKVQEFAWTLRENAGNAEDCDLLDRCATEIYTACGFQDLTAQRIAKVVEALSFIDHRLKTLLVTHDLAEDFAADELMISENVEPAPLVQDDIWMSEAHQAEIDDTFAFFEPAAETAEPTMIGADLMDLDEPPAALEATAPAPAARDDEDIIEPLARAEDPYAALPVEEKLRAFR
jgi:chemotaxis regulatin CheY-phosphate phosphatase CheZ